MTLEATTIAPRVGMRRFSELGSTYFTAHVKYRGDKHLALLLPRQITDIRVLGTILDGVQVSP